MICEDLSSAHDCVSSSHWVILTPTYGNFSLSNPDYFFNCVSVCKHGNISTGSGETRGVRAFGPWVTGSYKAPNVALRTKLVSPTRQIVKTHYWAISPVPGNLKTKFWRQSSTTCFITLSIFSPSMTTSCSLELTGNSLCFPKASSVPREGKCQGLRD